MDMITTDDNKLIISAFDHRFIQFFDINNNFSLITIINDIMAFNLNIIHNKLFIGTYEGLYLINLKNYKISYHFENYEYINSIIPLNNGNILISCHNKKNKNINDNKFESGPSYIIEYKYENDNFKQIKAIKTDHTSTIRGLFLLKDNIILSWSFGDREYKIHICDLNSNDKIN